MKITSITKLSSGPFRFYFDLETTFYYADIVNTADGFEVVDSSFVTDSEPYAEQVEAIKAYRNTPTTEAAHSCFDHAVTHFTHGDSWELELWSHVNRTCNQLGYSALQREQVIIAVNQRIDARVYR